MIAILRQLLFLGIAAVVSWWFFLEGAPAPLTSPPEAPVVADHIALMPITEAPAAEVAPAQDRSEAETEASAPEPPEAIEVPEEQPEEPLTAEGGASPPPPPGDEPAEEPEPAVSEATSELGDPEAEGELAADPRSAPDAPEALMSDSTLVESARRELEGEVQSGFATELLSTAAEQLQIARAFGEELVLVPRSSLETSVDQQIYFRLTADGEVQHAVGLDKIDSGRYRDFFQFEYAKLPDSLRLLRKSVLNRAEVYLFAALIPVQEWALVVGRRERALRASGRELGAVRRFTLDYVRLADGRYDIVVDEILFTDGTRYRPANETL